MEMKVEGLRELDQALERLGPVAGAKVMRQAMFAATKPILEAAQANVGRWPRGSGALLLALRRVFQMVRGAGETGTRFVMQVAPKRRVPAAVALYNLYYRRKRKGIFYGHLLEFGHRIGHRRSGYLRKTTSADTPRRNFASGRVGGGGQSAGSVAPQRFLRPALDTAGLRAQFLLRHELKKRIERALKKQDPASDRA